MSKETEELARDLGRKFPWLPINGEYRIANYIQVMFLDRAIEELEPHCKCIMFADPTQICSCCKRVSELRKQKEQLMEAK